ncbi:MSMEG_0565 family glycosyltransferase [Ancylobacter sp. MQZ15Z-1]|uniref:MSMEG_0565 family glycosyltransferase n=1 Tax=Ancylobacter mangrovi TaxID=2972472 RepID=A0A9X2PIR6_9HYPH|nr:MSMEG_0565 family glycosyltransferase [Ancylobacter mangrovi]MCS0496860.1 MSMEG_0565 family glycosyltransferase [Ancylobacter mangrovi]
MSAPSPARLRIAILAHSTNPRGGVVHALELGDALTRLGHEAVVHAPDPSGAGFFRPSLCGTVSVPASRAGADVEEMVHLRAGDYVRHFERAAHREFDVFHAQDGISGNALATLKERGLIGRFARTVHHIDRFDHAGLERLQRRAITRADGHFVVSRLWRATLAEDFGLDAEIVGNGVDLARFSPRPDGREAGLRARFGIGKGPVVLSVGGVEPRKNTRAILAAFAQLHALMPDAQLVIAGGASVLDHSRYADAFAAERAASGLPERAVIVTGPLPHDDMPALYRIADLLAFASVKEGFGLVALEAMASGVPCVISRIAPFTEHLRDDEAVWCDPASIASIADAFVIALKPDCAARLARRGPAAAARHDWDATARAHVATYQRLREPAHA